MTVYFNRMDSPIGPLVLTGDGRFLTGLYMQDQKHPCEPRHDWQPHEELFRDAREQLTEYFSGTRHGFDLALTATGTDFQRRVWRALADIPYGQTCSYGELARRIDKPTASRAVGLANGRNPISIIVPCHRVIGADGSLTGYGGGLERKRWLLNFERRRSGKIPAYAS